MGQVAGIALVWFIIEMLVWYAISNFISGWYVFFWFIIAATIGIVLMRKGLSTLNPMAQQMKAGGMLNPSMQPNENTMLKTVAMAVAGILLFIPGVLSDFLALLVVLPPVQKKLKDMGNKYIMNNQEKMMEMMMKQMGGQNPFGAGGSPFGSMNGQSPFNSNNPFGSNFGNTHTTVDGTAKKVKKDAKKLKSANDD